jgi:hypothetical protein
MTIARELVTRLSFAFDRTNLDKFERAISGFKTKFDIASLTIKTAFNKMVEYAKDFSNAILKNNAIAKFTKTSISDLTALQNAFQKFDVNPDIFTGFFENLSRQIVDAKFGANNVFQQLVTQSNGTVRKFVDGQLTTAKQAIYDFRDFIKKEVDEQKQLRYIQNFFEVDLQTSEAIRQLFQLTNDEFDKLIEKERISAQELEKNKQIAQGFKTQINQLETEWSKFNNKVAQFAVPLLTQSLGGLNQLTEQVQSEGFLSTLKFVGEAIVDGVKTAFGEGHLQQLQRQVVEEDIDFWRRLREQEISRINNQNTGITNNNRIEVNVPPTTDAQQAGAIGESIKSSMDAYWDEKVREVVNNNPVVE